MGAISWLAIGQEQNAAPVLQPLPVPYTRTYKVGGNLLIRDASAANFNPHFWLFELSTAKWRMGYDGGRRPVYTTELYQGHVFGVLLVDYWQPPYEKWRENPPFKYAYVALEAQDMAPVVPTFSDDSSATAPSFTDEPAAVVPTWSPG